VKKHDWLRASVRALFITTMSLGMGVVIGCCLFMYASYSVRAGVWFYPKWWFFSAVGDVVLSGVLVYLLRPKYSEEEECKPPEKIQAEAS